MYLKPLKLQVLVICNCEYFAKATLNKTHMTLNNDCQGNEIKICLKRKYLKSKLIKLLFTVKFIILGIAKYSGKKATLKQYF